MPQLAWVNISAFMQNLRVVGPSRPEKFIYTFEVRCETCIDSSVSDISWENQAAHHELTTTRCECCGRRGYINLIWTRDLLTPDDDAQNLLWALIEYDGMRPFWFRIQHSGEGWRATTTHASEKQIYFDLPDCWRYEKTVDGLDVIFKITASEIKFAEDM